MKLLLASILRFIVLFIGYQYIALISMSVFRNWLCEPDAEIFHDAIMLLHPGAILYYSLVLYIFTITSFLSLLIYYLYTYRIYGVETRRKFAKSGHFLIIFILIFILSVLFSSLFDLEMKKFLAIYAFPLDSDGFLGVGYLIGTLIFSFTLLPYSIRPDLNESQKT